ncbi:endonuclease [ANME-1 cluster archaeon AG-394-G21]|nr:endonuclease [ANME-1 cluster archaeon AG-394-G21]NAT10480.1 endonuclease [ANME-1 cluster archaeon AG-394-G06]
MVRVGVHVSIAGSIDKAVDRAVEKNCDTFQIFSCNPRGWKVRELTDIEITRFIEKVAHSGIYPPVDHMPYLPNLAAPVDEVYNKSVAALIVELKRCDALQIPYLVTHLGSHRGYGKAEGFRRIGDAVNEAFREVDNEVMLLLENTAGTKNSMGGTFEDIQHIMAHIEHNERLGICFDTCHAFVAGYDLRTEKSLNTTLLHFDEVIGLEHLKLIHLNDAKAGLNSRLDRHEHIGLGYIGEDGFRVFINEEQIKDLPMILETPVDDRRDDIGNIRKVRELADGY